MGLAEVSFMEEASASLGLSEATAWILLDPCFCGRSFMSTSLCGPSLSPLLSCLAFLHQDFHFSPRAGGSGLFTHLSQIPVAS